LLAEDDALLGDGIRAGLKLANYAVDWVQDGQQADLALRDHAYDACVLDLGLPQRDGLSVLRALRERGSDLPVLILTARGSSSEKVAGLDEGADDYLVKPFDLDELHARLRALMRRSAGQSSPKLRCGALALDPASKEVTLHGEPVALSAREFALLQDLLSHSTHIRTRAQLEESLYAWGEEAGSNTVEVYIHHLRKKLGSQAIRTLRGLGYQIGTIA
jgi:DNA-binding response OmpR family regulator